MVLVIYYIVMLRSNNAVPFSEITKDLNCPGKNNKIIKATTKENTNFCCEVIFKLLLPAIL